MVIYQNFAGNSSDDKNCDWLHVENEDEHLICLLESLDLECYKEFTHLHCNRNVVVENIRRWYANDKWSHAHSQLLEDLTTFTRLCLGPIQWFCHQENKRLQWKCKDDQRTTWEEGNTSRSSMCGATHAAYSVQEEKFRVATIVGSRRKSRPSSHTKDKISSVVRR